MEYGWGHPLERYCYRSYISLGSGEISLGAWRDIATEVIYLLKVEISWRGIVTEVMYLLKEEITWRGIATELIYLLGVKILWMGIATEVIYLARSQNHNDCRCACERIITSLALVIHIKNNASTHQQLSRVGDMCFNGTPLFFSCC